MTFLSALADANNKFLIGVDGVSYPTKAAITASCGNGTYNGTAANLVIPFNTWVVIVLEKDGAKFQARVNGVNGAEVAHNNLTSSVAPVIGANAVGAVGGVLTGEIGDVFYFNQRIIGDADAMAALSSYVSRLYGIHA